MSIQNTSNATAAPLVVEKNTSTSSVTIAPSVTPTPPAKETKQPSLEELKNAVDTISKAIKQNQTNLDISIDSNTKEIVVKIVDSSTGDVITQFPSKQALAISESIDNNLKGLLLNDKA